MQRARKRYNVKAKLPKIYAKRSLRRTTITDQELSTRCEYSIYFNTNTGGTEVFTTAGVRYVSIGAEFSNSHTWINLAPQFLKYKITGLSVRVTPIHDDTAVFNYAVSVPINLAFYPGYSATTVSSVEVMANDKALRVEPNLTTPQTKYWRFPDKYFESSGTGFGLWTSTASIGSQVGQLSVGNNTPTTTWAITKVLYSARISLYVVFGQRKT